VVCVADGPAALAHLAEAGAPDVAVLDLDMPGMDGAELARAIRAAGFTDLPLVLVTSIDPAGVDLTEFQARVSKPVRAATLRAAIHTVLARGESPPGSNGWPTPAAVAPVPDTVRILVAEDNAVNQKLAVAMLRKLGFEADVVANGIQAVDALARSSYGLVLMDCQMPMMDGYQATAAIRQSTHAWARIPIVAMTANAMQGDRELCLAAGMDDYVAKPVSLDDLAEKLARLVGTATAA